MTESKEKSVREKQLDERKARMASLRRSVPSVRVTPKNDEIRKYLRHMPSGVKFPDSGSAVWPNDTFTQRRIADGDVTVEEEKSHARHSRAHSET